MSAVGDERTQLGRRLKDIHDVIVLGATPKLSISLVGTAADRQQPQIFGN
jgi:hypothetical protein